MLNLFRKHATSWLIKIALFLIVIVFIFWGGYAYKSKKETQMARVDDYYISIPEYDKSYDHLVDVYRNQLGSSFSEETIRRFNLKKQALDLIINRYIINKAAAEMGLVATNEEVQQKILEYPVFQSEGTFDKRRYNLVLQQNRMTPEAFEEEMRTDLTSQKLEEFIKRRAVVTENEILADFNFHFSQVQLAYVLLEPQSFEDKVVMDGKSIEAYYEEHKDRYQEPEKRQIAAVLFKTDSYMDEVKISDSEITQYYDENKDQFFKEEEIKARHILFSLKADAPEDEVAKAKAEAQKVLDEARKGTDFAELARKYSQDPGSAKEGGDLGFFNRERMVPAFSSVAFELKPGEISDLVRTQFGFHIIKVEEVRPEKTEPLEEARPRIEMELKEEKARDLAYLKAREFADLVYAQRDITKAAESQGVKLISTEGFVARDGSLPGVEPTGPTIMGKLFGLTEKEVSDVIEFTQGFLVAQVQAIQSVRPFPFEDVKEKVQTQYKTERGQTLAREKGAEILKKAQEAKSLETAAKEFGLEIEKSEWFSRREPARGLKLTGEALNSVFQLGEAGPFPDTVLSSGNRVLVCQLLGRKPPDRNLDKERESIQSRIEQQKQTMIWQGWIEDQRNKTRIEVYKEL